MQVKIHDSYRKIVAIADSDLIGKTFEEDIRVIEVRDNFFKGEEKTREEVIGIMREFERDDATFNIVGKESIQTALDAGIIEEHGIARIDNIPIALGLF